MPSGSGPRAVHRWTNSPSTCSCSALVDLIPAVPSSKRVDIGSGIYHADRQGDGDRAAPGDSHCRGGSGAEGSAVVIRHPERAGGVVRLALRPRRCGVHHRLPARQQLLVGSHGLVVLPPSLGAFGRPLSFDRPSPIDRNKLLDPRFGCSPVRAGVSMSANPSTSVFVVELDAMIARVEAACERLRIAASDPGLSTQRARTISLNRRKMGQTLMRLGLARKKQLAHDQAARCGGPPGDGRRAADPGPLRRLRRQRARQSAVPSRRREPPSGLARSRPQARGADDPSGTVRARPLDPVCALHAGLPSAVDLGRTATARLCRRQGTVLG